MTTIVESTTTLGGMLDGIADGLLNNHGTEWSEPDADITNDQSTEDWSDNARLLQHSTSGVYLTMYVVYRDGFDSSDGTDHLTGIRFVVSDGWNTTENHPSGKSNVIGQDPFAGSTPNRRDDSYKGTRDKGQGYGQGIWTLGNEAQNYNPDSVNSRSDAASLIEATWWGSVGTDHITVAAYDSQDTAAGGAGWFTWEHADSKFWADGSVPFIMASGCNHGGYLVNGLYSFEWVEGHDGDASFEFEKTDPAAWGYINPDASDDTYFFRRPIVYTEANIPSAYVTAFIYNQPTEGSSGDTISYDGTDYRLFQDTGAAESDIPAVGLRYT